MSPDIKDSSISEYNTPLTHIFQDTNIYISKWLRKLCILVLLLLPFQKLPSTLLGIKDASSGTPEPIWLKGLSYVDELSLIIFFSVAITFFLMMPSTFKLPKLAVTKWLIIFVGYGLILAAFKGIPLTQATFGIYDRVKNIAVLYLFSSINFKREEFINALWLMIIVGFILAVFGAAAEILALGTGLGIGYFVMEEQRLGLYRALSLTGSGNQVYLGSYVILIYFLGNILIKSRSIRLIHGASLLLLTFLTFSKQAWLGLAVMVCMLSRKMILISSLILIGILLMFLSGKQVEVDQEKYFRLFAFMQSLQIVYDNPLTGLGPGMFGGIASILWQSPIYDTWPPVFKEFAYRVSGIDQFWPSIWGEFGSIGFIIYSIVFVSIFIVLGNTAKSSSIMGDKTFFRIGKILQYYLVAIVVMGTAGGLNAAFITYTYFALVGIYLSLCNKYSKSILSKHVNKNI